MNEKISGKKAVVFGGRGFIGSHLVNLLCKNSCQVDIITRSDNKKLDFFLGSEPGQVTVKKIDKFSENQLDYLVKNADLVFNLIGILYEKKKKTFSEVHVNIPREIASAAKRNGVRNFIHLSALNIEKSISSLYSNSKLLGEEVVREKFPNCVILRPSVVFGKRDSFTNFFLSMSKFSPFLPIIGTPEIKKKGLTKVVISAIKGPCLAAGLANKMRTGTVIASENKDTAKLIQKIITTEYYSTETSEDVKGVEFCGAIKNIYSMLIGASEGLSNPSAPESIKSKYFLNTSASLIHRSISEMVKFVKYFGGNETTVYGLAGLGDLYVSAIGGRNSQMGKYLGQGTLYKDAKEKFMKDITVEGAQLALEIGPILLKELKKNEFPLMFNILETICNNKKLSINW